MRTKKELLDKHQTELFSSIGVSRLNLEVQIDIRDQLKRIADLMGEKSVE